MSLKEVKWLGQGNKTRLKARIRTQILPHPCPYVDDHPGLDTSRTRIIKNWDSTWSTLLHLPQWAAAHTPTPLDPLIRASPFSISVSSLLAPRGSPSSTPERSHLAEMTFVFLTNWFGHHALFLLISPVPNTAYRRAWSNSTQLTGKAGIINPEYLESDLNQMNKMWSLCINS